MLIIDPKIMIMDEPTSVLTPGEVSDLFLVLKKLSKSGMSILYISHKLEEIRRFVLKLQLCVEEELKIVIPENQCH